MSSSTRKGIYSRSRRSEFGNVFFTLFGAVAVVGVLGAGIMATMRGPLSTMVEVNRREQAKAELRVASSLVLVNSGDTCADTDSYTEGPDPTGAGPTGGGLLPAVGAAQNDPWGNPYGYCAWDHGDVPANHDGCGTNILAGNTSTNNIAIAVFSSGPDGTFQTSCVADNAGVNDYVEPDGGGGDDIVVTMTYTQAISGSGGLWTDVSPSEASIARDLTVTGSGTSDFSGNLNIQGTGAFQDVLAANASIQLPDDNILGGAACGPANSDGLLRVNDGALNDQVPVLEVCDESASNWVPAGSPWRLTGSDLYYTAGNVGIGTGMTNPNNTLDIVGTAEITQTLDLGGNFNINSGQFTVSAADGNTVIGGTLDVQDNTTITGNTDDGSTNPLTVEDSGSSPVFTVDSDGNTDATGNINTDGFYQIDGAQFLSGDSTIPGTVLLGTTAGSSVTGDNNIIVGGSTAATLTTGTDNIIIGSGLDVPTATGAATTDYLNIGDAIIADLSSGEVGIGFPSDTDVSSFDDALEVNGDADINGILNVTGTAGAGDAITLGDNVIITGDTNDGSTSPLIIEDSDNNTLFEIDSNGFITSGIDASDVYIDGTKNLDPGGACGATEFSKWTGSGWTCVADGTGGGGGDGVGTEGLPEVLANDNDADNNKITGLADPTLNQDAATKKYVDDEIASSVGSLSQDRIEDTGDQNTYIDVDTANDDSLNTIAIYNNGSQSAIFDADGNLTLSDRLTATYPTTFTNGIDDSGIYVLSGNPMIGIRETGSSDGWGMATNISNELSFRTMSESSSGTRQLMFSPTGQVGIGTGVSAVDDSARLEITSTTQGMLTPRMTIAQRDLIGTPATGLLVFATDAGDNGLFQFYDGFDWVDVGAGGAEGGGLWTPDGTNDYIEYDDSLGGVRIGRITGQPAPETDWTLDVGNSVVYTSTNTVAIGSSTVSDAGGANLNVVLDLTGDIAAAEYCDENGENCFTAASVSGGGTNVALSNITDATADNTTDNGAWNQAWNWQLTAAETGFEFSESGASTGGTTGGAGDQFILGASTLTSSTAVPLFVENRGDAHSFQVYDQAADTTPFVIDEDGFVGIGKAVPTKHLDIEANVSGGNLAAMRNLAADGYASIDFLDSGGSFAAAFGYGNAGVGGLADTVYMSTGNQDFVIWQGATEGLRLVRTVGLGVGNFSSDTVESMVHVQTGDIRLDGGAGNEAGCFRFDDTTTNTLQYSNDCTAFTSFDDIGGTPGGNDTEVQYNDNGDFAGDAGMTYNAATDTLTLGTALHVGDYIQITGQAGDAPTFSFYLNDLADVDTSGVADGYLLSYDNASGEWIPYDPSGLGGGSSLWTDNTDYITRENFHILDTGLAAGSTTAGLDGDGTYAFFDPDKGAFRGGIIASSNDAWQDTNIGNQSFAYGRNVEASGDQSLAIGDSSTASGWASVALGSSNTTTGDSSITAGNNNSIGANAWANVAMGDGNIVDGDGSGGSSAALGYNNRIYPDAWGGMAFGLSNTIGATGTPDFGDYGVALGGWNTVLGDGALAVGESNIASGDYSRAMGYEITASGLHSTAIGNEVVAGSGTADPTSTMGAGHGHATFALGLQTASQATAPVITGDRSAVFFFDGNTNDANSGYDFDEDDKFALIGGEFQIDDQSSTANKGCIRYDSGNTKLQFSHDCSAYSDFGGSSSLWTDNTDYITRENFHILDTGLAAGSTTAGLDGDGTYAFYNPDKGAFRVGAVAGGSAAWEDTNVGGLSFGFGGNPTASNTGSIAMGLDTTASGYASVALGEETTASATGSFAMGYQSVAGGNFSEATGYQATASGLGSFSRGLITTASGEYATAIGERLVASGALSTAIGREVVSGSGTADGSYTTGAGHGHNTFAVGMQSATHTTDPVITGDRSAVFYFDGGTVDANSGYDFDEDDKFALIGGEFQIDDQSSTANKGCIRYDSGNTKLQFSHDCSAYSDFGGGSSLWTDATNTINYGNFYLWKTGTTMTGLSGSGLYYDVDNASLYIGDDTNDKWVEADLSTNSVIAGTDLSAAVNSSIVIGSFNNAESVNGTGSFIGGYSNTYDNNAGSMIVQGNNNQISYAGNGILVGENSEVYGNHNYVFGQEVIANYSTRTAIFSLGDHSSKPSINGDADDSFVVLLGDQGGTTFNTAERFAVLGGEMLLDDDGSAGSQGCMRYVEGTGLQYSNDCSSYANFGVASAGGADTQVQYNSGGSLAGEAAFTYDDSSDILTVATLSATDRVSLTPKTSIGTPNGLALNDISDVDVTGAADGEVLAYNNATGNWEPSASAGGGGGLWTDQTTYIQYNGTGGARLGDTSSDTYFHIDANTSGNNEAGIFMVEQAGGFANGNGAKMWYDGNENKFHIAAGMNVQNNVDSTDGDIKMTIVRDSDQIGFHDTSPAQAVSMQGTFEIDNDTSAGSSGCLRYDGAALEFSNDCSSSWTDLGGGGSITSADTQVHFNNAGAEAGDAGLTYVAATDTLTIGSTVNIGSLVNIGSTSSAAEPTGAVAAGGGGGGGSDNLGDHLATEDLDMDSNNILNIASLELDVVTSIGTPLSSSSLNLNDLGDVDTSGASTNDVLTWDGSDWIAQAAGGGGGGALSDITDATGTNTLANAAYAQVWNWNSLTTQTGLALGSSSVTSGNVLSVVSTNTGSSDATLNVSSATTTNDATALRGEVTGASGVTYGIRGSNTSTSDYAAAVYGYQTGASGLTYGVVGENDSNTTEAAAVAGLSNGTTAETYGVAGYNDSTGTDSAGVFGYQGATTGLVRGVWGISESTTTGATGVGGFAYGASGENYGVFGESASASGYGGYFTNSNGGVALYADGDIEYTGTITDVSDMRLKDNIEPLNKHGALLEKIDAVDTYSFTMKDDETGRTEYGVMAQELEKIFPYLVHTANDEMGTKSVNYVGLIAPMIEATKELKAENDNLKAELAELRESQQAMMEEVNGLKVHTGYGISKAEMGLFMLIGMGGTAILFMLGSGVLLRRQRREAE